RRMRLIAELKTMGVALVAQAGSVKILDGQVAYTNERGQERTVAADNVIVAQGATGDATLADELTSAGFSVHSIGDCTGVGYIEGAMEDAADLAMTL
ncbi:MAG: NADH:flavin oxidoreductase, partial [Halioglobus sp.]|nr:NADH:flavin oxidoreductase [Halioglobus sp.]